MVLDLYFLPFLPWVCDWSGNISRSEEEKGFGLERSAGLSCLERWRGGVEVGRLDPFLFLSEQVCWVGVRVCWVGDRPCWVGD